MNERRVNYRVFIIRGFSSAIRTIQVDRKALFDVTLECLEAFG